MLYRGLSAGHVSQSASLSSRYSAGIIRKVPISTKAGRKLAFTSYIETLRRSPFIQLALQMASHQLEPPPPQDPNAEVEEIVPDSFCSHLKPEFQHSHPHLAAIVQMSGNRKLAGFHFLPPAHFFLLACNFGQFFCVRTITGYLF